MSCKKIIMIFLAIFCYCPGAIAQNVIVKNDLDAFEQHIDSLLKGIYQGRIPIYDSVGNIISLDGIYERFVYDDVSWLMGGHMVTSYSELGIELPVYTRYLRYGNAPDPSMHLGYSPVGIPVLNGNADDSRYFSFDKKIIDENTGQLRHRNFHFKVKKNDKPVNYGAEKLVAIANYYSEHPDAKVLHDSILTNDKCYRNKQILYKGETIPTDACQQQYYLCLNKNNRFEQKFINSEQSSFIGSPVIHGVDLFVGYQLNGLHHKNFDEYSCCSCFIETDEGLWQVKNNELILYTYAGVEMVRYKILKAGDSTLELETGDVRVTLEKR